MARPVLQQRRHWPTWAGRTQPDWCMPLIPAGAADAGRRRPQSLAVNALPDARRSVQCSGRRFVVGCCLLWRMQHAVSARGVACGRRSQGREPHALGAWPHGSQPNAQQRSAASALAGERRSGAASPHALSWPQRRHQCNNTSASATLPATVQVPRQQHPQRHPACIMERPEQSTLHVSPCAAAT
jgi:hypothetical protein